MSPLNSTITGESWKSFTSVVFGVWLSVWLYAALHNQYLIRIAPEHFTEWHYRMPFFTSHTMLGVAYALGASVSPGLLLGLILFMAGRLFGRKKLSPTRIIFSTAWVWLGVEICAGMVGLLVWRTGRGIYPDWAYPDASPGMLITQSIQITAYITGALFSVILIAVTWEKRKNPVDRDT